MKPYRAFFRKHYAFQIGEERGQQALGYVPEKAVANFDWSIGWTMDTSNRNLTFDHGSSVKERTLLFSAALQALFESRKDASLDKPTGEMLPVFGPAKKHLLNIDRAAASFFGTVSYGVQMIAYRRTDEGLRYWIPRRAKTKRSYPGMLDNCVGGALNAGETPLSCLIREAGEEASLPPDYIREHAKPYDILSYHMATNGNGEEAHQPQIMHVYHIELPQDIKPTPSDGEVEKFELMTLEEVQAALKRGEFKNNCAATWLSYMISTGILNAENESNLYRISMHLHRRLRFPTK